MLDTPAAYSSPEDICNEALNLVGARMITSLTENSREAQQCQFIYDKIRRAELRRNTWVFSTRRTALRAIAANMTQVFSSSAYSVQAGPQTGTMGIVPTVWSASVTYTPGAIVTDPNVPGLLWTSLAQENIGNTPGEGTGQVWDAYFGPVVAEPFNPTLNYWAGELVYVQDPNTQAINVYRSLTNNNGSQSMTTIVNTTPTAGPVQTTITNTTTITTTTSSAATVTTTLSTNGNPWILTEWNPFVTYNLDQVVVYEFTLYKCLAEQNHGNIPGVSATWAVLGTVNSLGSGYYLMSAINWLPVPCTVQSFIMAYPVGAGPVQENATRNVYRLPAGFLRPAPQDPTADRVQFLGAPSYWGVKDWQYEGKYLTTRNERTILYRFIADITKVADMDDMFCNGLACRIGIHICESLTQSASKLQMLGSLYKTIMGEARIVNAIEGGIDPAPEDDYITVRI